MERGLLMSETRRTGDAEQSRERRAATQDENARTMTPDQALDSDLREKLGQRGFSIRQRLDFVEGDGPTGPEAREQAWYLIDGPGLSGYVLPAHDLRQFASGREVRRPIELTCPYCRSRLEERVSMGQVAGAAACRIRCCRSCDWAARL
jgi:hypothetical protein